MDSREISPAPVYLVDDNEYNHSMSDIESVAPSDTTAETMSTLESQEAIGEHLVASYGETENNSTVGLQSIFENSMGACSQLTRIYRLHYLQTLGR
jgi:hypothetical protein